MSRLEEVYARGSRWRAAGRAALLLVGSLVAGVGFVAATASLVAGFGYGKAGALKLAVLFGGVLLVATFLALFARGIIRGRARASTRSRALVGVGVAFALAGLALFWTALPAGWTGRLAGLPAVAVSAYGVGLLAVFGAGLAADSADGEASSGTDPDRAGLGTDRNRRRIGRDGLGTDRSGTDAIGGVESVVLSSDDREEPPASAVGDGGEADDELEFFDGDERS